ncbi:sucrase ferredoxin [Nocardioides hwasunensis]|uniref:Sucrase ferredoxin n=1 Tax=Nocardioides hwasunensis TaxID=397258 RepID=A0ABR8MH09_9ACTN|nr:sucrase ferredoxin [Nocardioides hwasunensis]MBD3914830.1 sucrase ferredoxin [Nocardioides hwasunensis]
MTFRCSDEAAARRDPVIGTAPPQHDWLLVEHPGPWPITAPFGADLPTTLLRDLGHPELRTLFVRRHGREGAADRLTGPRRWFRSRAGAVRTGLWQHPDDLLASLGDAGGEAYAEPLLLVCTHGVHDLCCAVKGRPVAAALAGRWPEATWECSHLGGDRFAPNVLVLPDLGCYGGLDADDAVPTVEAHFDRRIDTTWLRGVAGLHPAEQVALGVVLERWGPAAISDATAHLVEQDGTFDAGRWTIDVVGTGPLPASTRVVVASSRRPEALLTCRTQRATRALQWDVLEVSAPPVRGSHAPSGDR